MDSERTGSPGGHVCEALCGLRSVFCSQGARRRLRTGRAHVLAWGTPRNARFALNAQGDVMAACVVGIRQEGIKSLPDGAVQEGRGTRSANSRHDVTQKERGRELPRWCARWKKIKKQKQASLRVNRIPGQGWKTPLLGHRIQLVRGVG